MEEVLVKAEETFSCFEERRGFPPLDGCDDSFFPLMSAWR